MSENEQTLQNNEMTQSQNIRFAGVIVDEKSTR